MSQSGADHYLSVERSFDASVDRLYRAFAEPGQLARWFGPHDVAVDPGSVMMDFRVGGLLHLIMAPIDEPSSGTPLDLVFEEIEPDVRLVLGDAWHNGQTGEVIHTQLEVAFAALGEVRSGLTLRQGPFSQEMLAAAEAGWAESFEKLEDHLAGVDA